MKDVVRRYSKKWWEYKNQPSEVEIIDDSHKAIDNRKTYKIINKYGHVGTIEKGVPTKYVFKLEYFCPLWSIDELYFDDYKTSNYGKKPKYCDYLLEKRREGAHEIQTYYVFDFPFTINSRRNLFTITNAKLNIYVDDPDLDYSKSYSLQDKLDGRYIDLYLDSWVQNLTAVQVTVYSKTRFPFTVADADGSLYIYDPTISYASIPGALNKVKKMNFTSSHNTQRPNTTKYLDVSEAINASNAFKYVNTYITADMATLCPPGTPYLKGMHYNQNKQIAYPSNIAIYLNEDGTVTKVPLKEKVRPINIDEAFVCNSCNLSMIDFTNLDHMTQTFAKTTDSTIHFGNADFSTIKTFTDVFKYPTDIPRYRFITGNIKNIHPTEGKSIDLNFAFYDNLSSQRSCFISMLEALADVTEENEIYTVTILQMVYNILTEEEITMVTSKGWTVNVIAP